MALIPNDVGIRLRLQGDGQLLQPLQPVLEIPAELPELRPGHVFTARIQDALPENTYKALVAGKSLTLSLPEGAQVGDTLDLVVIDRSARAVFAQRVSPETLLQAQAAAPDATLSRAARLIGSLLPAEGEAPPAVPLNRGQPLLASAPAMAGDAKALAPALALAVKQSGLFYEAHQAQWTAGHLPLAELLQEPQARHAPQPATGGAAAEAPPADAGQKSAPAIRQPMPGGGLLPAAGAGAPAAAGVADLAATNAAASAPAAEARTSSTPAGIPEELRPIVQQQLDAVATQRLAWHGEVWPDQRMAWEIEWEGQRGDQDGGDPGEWATTLRLVTPRLGELEARLQLAPSGVRIAIETPYGATAADLREATPLLEDSLAAAGVPLLGLRIRHDDANP